MPVTQVFQSGIEAIGPVQWGAHLCHLYRTRHELHDTALPYFIVGVQSNDACLWLTSAPAEAGALLSDADRELAHALDRGQVEIVDAVGVHRPDGSFDRHAALKVRREAEARALGQGLAGLRIALDMAWVEPAEAEHFKVYERDASLTLASQQSICLCLYPLSRRGCWELEDIAGCHDIAVNWQRTRLARFAPEILVVDDEPLIGSMLEFVFLGKGLGVRVARSGKEAVDTYRRHRDTIGVVLLDVQMPGLDGPGTLKALQEANPAIRCCFMSGDTGSYTTRELLAMGAGHVFTKPFRDMDRIRKALWQEIHEGMGAAS